MARAADHGGYASPVAGPQDPRAPSTALVIWILIATMLGFAGSMVYSAHIGARLDENALSIATNASPAIEHLSAARGEVLRIQLAAVSAVGRFVKGAPVDRAPFDASVSSLHRELTAYMALPLYADEHERFSDAERSVRALDAQVSALVAHLEAGDVDAAVVDLRTGLSPAAAHTDEALALLVNFNAREEHRLGVEIPALRKYADRVGYLLAAVTASSGALLMVLVMRAVRRYQTLLRAQNRLTEARAREAAEFGSRLESLIAASMKISETITTIDDSEKVFQTIADEARGIIDADFSAVGVGSDPAAFDGLPAAHPTMGPILSVPIVHGGLNIGNLFMSRTKGAPPFTDRDERAALLLAGYVGVSITNSRLYKQAMAAKRSREDLLATVSHDLKNPLNVIRLSTHLLRRSADPATAELAERIDRTAERMSRLIGDLLEASKIEAGVLRTAPKPEAAALLVKSAIEVFTQIANEKSIQLRCEAEASLPAVLCERDLVSRVFSNLVGNAIKFSPAGSSIAVVAKELPGEVEFSVSDAGPGIPVGQLPHVFDRYWQEKGTDRRGTGLGLYIAKGIVEAHGGRIWVESAPGQGTTMSFTLPSVTAREARDAPPA